MIDIHVGDVLGCVGRGDLFDDYLGQTEAAYRFVNGVIKIIKHAHEFIIVDQCKFAAMVANQSVAFTGERRLFMVYIHGWIIPAKDRPFRGSSLRMHRDPLSEQKTLTNNSELSDEGKYDCTLVKPCVLAARGRVGSNGRDL
jgi:hypothetical protein